MTEDHKGRSPAPPGGLLRHLLRLPVWIYRLGLGRLLGRRFLLINHMGRKSNKQRQTVVEVVRHNPATGIYVVASGYGPRADWYRNLQQQPEVTIEVAGRSLPVVAQFLSPEAGADEMERYAKERPIAARSLAQLLGYQTDGSPASYRRVARDHIPFVAFRPRDESLAV